MIADQIKAVIASYWRYINAGGKHSLRKEATL